MTSTQSHTTQSLIPTKSTWTSIPQPRQLTPQQGMTSTGWGDRESRSDYYISPGWCHKEGSSPPKKDGFGNIGEELSTEVLAAVSSALSPEPQTPACPHPTPFCFILSLPDTRVSGCKWDFMNWPFKRVPVSSRLLSLPGRQNPHWYSQPEIIWMPLPGSGALAWRPPHGVETPCSSGGTFVAGIALQYLSRSLWEQGLPFSCLCPSYQSWCGFFCTSLVIRLMFR